MTLVTAEVSRDVKLQKDIEKYLLTSIAETAAAAVTLSTETPITKIVPDDALNKLKISTFERQCIIDKFNHAYGTNLEILESSISACVHVKDFIKLVTDAYTETNR